MQSEAPAMMAVEFAKLVKRARRRADGIWWDGCCPSHDDRHASVSFCDGDEGLIVECHAGCSFEQIAAAVGRRPADFFHNGQGGRELVAAYDYTDAGGVLAYQVARFEPKDFRCRRPDGHGGWTWNMAGVSRVPYRLLDLPEQRRVYTVEGEKDADALAALGLAATTNEGGAGKWRPEHTAGLVAAAVPEVVVLPDNDPTGAQHGRAVAQACLAAGVRVKLLPLPGLPDKGDVSDWLAAGHTAAELEALADAAPGFAADDAPLPEADPPLTGIEPELRREGFDLTCAWPNGIRFTLTAIRDSRDGVRGELTITEGARRLSWGSVVLSSTSAREALRKKLEAVAPGRPWGEYLEGGAWHLTQAARQGDPLVTLTGTVTSPTRELVPRLLFEAEPTLIFGDGDTGKSLVVLALAAIVQGDAALPFGLKPARAVPVAYLDYETSRDTVESRLALLAAGLGIAPPPILYKRMTRPLVDEAAALAAEFARRGIGLVVVDSQMFAVASGDGAAFHEPITGFYNALRLFAPAASLVVSHVTGADARSGGPARPFGGAFAFNGPRLIWEAKRDPDITDATAIAFTCRKANNLPRRPDPFGLLFKPGDGTITVYPFDLREAAPETVAAAPLAYRLRLALTAGPQPLADLAQTLGAKPGSIRKTLQRLREAGKVILDGDLYRLVTP
jgi:hypothetical protein